MHEVEQLLLGFSLTSCPPLELCGEKTSDIFGIFFSLLSARNFGAFILQALPGGPQKITPALVAGSKNTSLFTFILELKTLLQSFMNFSLATAQKISA